jgi:hypothetical protein
MEWYEMPSFTYDADPGVDIFACPHNCGGDWHCALETDPDSPTRLAVREWHRPNCGIWDTHQPEGQD